MHAFITHRDSPSVSTISEEEMKEQEEELEQERQEEEARAEEVKQAAEKEASQEAPDTTWACESCTFINTGA